MLNGMHQNLNLVIYCVFHDGENLVYFCKDANKLPEVLDITNYGKSK